MKSKYESFDRSQLLIKPLGERKHDMGLDYILKLDEPAPEFSHPQLQGVAQRLIAAQEKGAARILMMGAHVIKSGASRHMIDLIERGYITHVQLKETAVGSLHLDAWGALFFIFGIIAGTASPEIAAVFGAVSCK